MYNNMQKQNKREYSWFAQPFDSNSPNLKCLRKGNITSFVWTFGQSIEISIEINKAFKSIPITINIYDVNYCPVVQQVGQIADEESCVYFRLTETDSQQYFKPGLYYCEVSAVQKLEDDQTINTTLLPMNACTLQVI